MAEERDPALPLPKEWSVIQEQLQALSLKAQQARTTKKAGE